MCQYVCLKWDSSCSFMWLRIIHTIFIKTFLNLQSIVKISIGFTWYTYILNFKYLNGCSIQIFSLPLYEWCTYPEDRASSKIFSFLFFFFCLWANIQFSSVQFSCSIVSDSLRPHEPQHARPPCTSPTPRFSPNSCPLNRWCHPAISSSVVPFSSCPQPFPA